jgi:hypothetical protein
MSVEKVYTRSFITGSHAYGEPTEDSDIDLVVLMTEREAEILATEAAASGMRGEPVAHWIQDAEYAKHTPQMYCLRFGILNLIVCTEEYQYDTWRKGTKRLKAAAPVPRAVAVELFAKLRQADARKLSESGVVGPQSGIKRPTHKPGNTADEARKRLLGMFDEPNTGNVFDEEIPF